jgi:hypothetical protein
MIMSDKTLTDQNESGIKRKIRPEWIPPLIGGIFAFVGILIGNWVGGSRSEDEWHRNRLTQLYSDCMYHSYRIKSTLEARQELSWNEISADVSAAVRSGQLLFGYLDGDEWDKMNSALSAFGVYGPSFAGGITSENSRKHLKSAADEMYDVSSHAYRYDPRIFPQWRIFTAPCILALALPVVLLVLVGLSAAKKAAAEKAVTMASDAKA